MILTVTYVSPENFTQNLIVFFVVRGDRALDIFSNEDGNGNIFVDINGTHRRSAR